MINEIIYFLISCTAIIYLMMKQPKEYDLKYIASIGWLFGTVLSTFILGLV